MTARVYDDTAWTGESGYVEGCRLLEEGGWINFGFSDGWGYYLTERACELLTGCGYDIGAAPSEAGAPLLTAALQVAAGEHATLEEALRDPEMAEAWQRLSHSVS